MVWKRRATHFLDYPSDIPRFGLENEPVSHAQSIVQRKISCGSLDMGILLRSSSALSSVMVEEMSCTCWILVVELFSVCYQSLR